MSLHCVQYILYWIQAEWKFYIQRYCQIIWVNFTNTVAVIFFPKRMVFYIWLTTPPTPLVCICPLLPDPFRVNFLGFFFGLGWEAFQVAQIYTTECHAESSYIHDMQCFAEVFDSRYKVTWDSNSNPQPSEFRSDAFPNELASLTEGWSSILNVYMRKDFEAQKLTLRCLINGEGGVRIKGGIGKISQI